MFLFAVRQKIETRSAPDRFRPQVKLDTRAARRAARPKTCIETVNMILAYGSRTDRPQIDSRSIRDRHQIDSRSTPDRHQIIPRSRADRSQIDPTSTANHTRVEPGSTPGSTQVDPGSDPILRLGVLKFIRYIIVFAFWIRLYSAGRPDNSYPTGMANYGSLPQARICITW